MRTRKLETIQRLEQLAFEPRTLEALKRAGVTVEELITEVRLLQVLQEGTDRLKKYPGIGKVRAEEIVRVIDDAGFILRESRQSNHARRLLTTVERSSHVLMEHYEDLVEMAPEALEAVDGLIREVLTSEELQVIKLRFGLTGERPSLINECANVLGVSAGQIRKLESMALVKLRDPGNRTRLEAATCYSEETLRSRVLQLQSDIDKLQQELDILKGCSPYPEFMLRGMPIEDLGFSVRTFNCLKRASIWTVGELCRCTEDDLLNVRNFSIKSLEEVRCHLSGLGLSLAA